MPATPLYHPEAGLGNKHTGRLGRLTKKESSSLSALKTLVRKQGLSLGLVKGPGEQNDCCLLRFLRAQGFEEKRALAALVSCVEWGAGVGLSELRGHVGPGTDAPGSLSPTGAAGLVTVGSGRDRQGRPLVIVRLGCLTESLVESCGKKALLRYFVWSVERMLERVAASMLSLQFIIEGVTVVCDARGWNQEKASDKVLSLLQDAAELGLSYYPERLGQVFLVNVAPGDVHHLRLAACALGLGAAVDSGRLRILSGDLPKWAPELSKVISRDDLPVEYGGAALTPLFAVDDDTTAAAANSRLNQQEGFPPNSARGSGNSNSGGGGHPGDGIGDGSDASQSSSLFASTAASRKNETKKSVMFGSLCRSCGSVLSAAFTTGGPSTTTYQIGGRQGIALVLSIWALFRKSAAAGSAALWGVALALAAREWTGGSVTVRSARGRVPLLHDPSILLQEVRGAKVEEGGGGRGSADGSRGEGVGYGGGDGVPATVAGGTSGGSGRVDDNAAGWGERRGEMPWSLAGARVEIMELAGTGQSGFDRFCIRVKVGSKAVGDGRGTASKEMEWVTWRRLTEFVALRFSLVQEACPGAEGTDRDSRMWRLPPVVPFVVLAPRLEAYLQRLLESGESSDREQLRAFLGADPITGPPPHPYLSTVDATGTLPPTTTASASASAATNGIATAVDVDPAAFAVSAGGGGGDQARRMTAPAAVAIPRSTSSSLSSGMATARAVEQRPPPVSADASIGSVVINAGLGGGSGGSGGGGGSFRSRQDSLSSTGDGGGSRSTGGGGLADSERDLVEVDAKDLVVASALRELPSLRPELRAMFQDPGECHTFKLPDKEQNQWLRRANRAAAHYHSTANTTANSSVSTSTSMSLSSSSSRRTTLASNNSGSSLGSHLSEGLGEVPVSPPSGLVPGSASASASPSAREGKRSRLVSPRRSKSERSKSPKRKEGIQASPRRREALKRLVYMVRRKGGSGAVGGKRSRGVGGGDASSSLSMFRLLHVDIFQVPPGNHLHRMDHIVGIEGGRAQARVQQLTSQKGETGGFTFVFVVNIQLPRTFTKKSWAASVVLYWGIPEEALAGSLSSTDEKEQDHTSPSPSPPLHTPPPPTSPPPSQLPPQHPHSPVSTQILADAALANESMMMMPPFERELLQRYIDLPFNRLSGAICTGSSASGFVTNDPTAHGTASGKAGRGGGEGVPGFSAVDEDESESGLFAVKDFRNMSFKVVTSVVQGRWTVRKAVDEGSSQVLSRKLTQRYFRGSLYMETDIEVGSSVAAESVVGVCLTEKCVLDVGFFLEGSRRILGCVRVSGMNPSLAEPLVQSSSLSPTATPETICGTVSGTAEPPSVLPTAFDLSPPGAKKKKRREEETGPVPLGNVQFEDTWEDNGDTHAFRVRGPGYLSGGGKVDAGKPFGRLVRVDLFKMEAGVDRMDNIGTVGRAAKVVRRLQRAGEFLVIVNLQVPGNPPLSVVLYYAVPVPPGGVPEKGAGGRTEGFLDLFRRFVDLGPLNNSEEGDDAMGSEGFGEDDGADGLGEAGGGGRLPGDDLRNMRFKLLPSILAGPWIVRKAVGSKPTLIAQKLTCRYFRTKAYFEVDIDIGSSMVAYNTVSLAIGYAKSLVADIGFCIQGEKEDELPEVLLGVARIRNLDVLLADPLEASETNEESDDEHDEHEEHEEEKGGSVAPKQEAPGGNGEDLASAASRQERADNQPDSAFVVVPAAEVAEGVLPLASLNLEGMFFDSGETHGLRVRGLSYVRDGRKILGGPAFGSLLRAELFRVDGNRHHLFRVDDICSHGRMRDRVLALLSVPNPPFLFIVNIQMPGDKAHSMVLVWGLRLREAEQAAEAGTLSREDENFLRLFLRYINLDLDGGLPTNDIRNRRLKMFPNVLQGPWVVRKAVGKPFIVGRRLQVRYFRRPGYFEVDIDVGSSALASYATHLAGGYAKHVVLDLAFALQGEAQEELPERLIGSARIVRPDLERSEPLDYD